MSEYPTYLIHFGIKGQKWGDRRYQNEDGTLTEEGKRRYGYGERRFIKSQQKINRKFDSYTESIKRDQAAGKNISNRRIRKALKLGMEYRMNERSHDKINRTHDYIEKTINGNLIGAGTASVAAGIGAIASGSKKIGIPAIVLGSVATAAGIIRGRKYYKNISNMHKNATLKDLENHGIKIKDKFKNKK